MSAVGEYRGFVIYDDADGWYAENAGGTCLGPFDIRAKAERAVDADLLEHPWKANAKEGQ